MIEVSVCIATYNGEKYIKEQIESILHQTQSVDEIVISDNYSTDSTMDILMSFNEEKIKVYSFREPDVSLNFENAIKHASGKYVFLCDQDDIWIENKVELMMEQSHENCLVISNAQVFNSKGIIGDWFSLRKSTRDTMSNLIRFSYLGCCFLAQKELLNKCMPFPNTKTLISHDNWIYFNAAFYGKIKIIDECLVKYRRHENNVSGGVKSKRSIFEKILYRLRLIYYLYENIIHRRYPNI